MVLQQPVPGIDCTRHGDGMRALPFDSGNTVFYIPVDAGRLGRTAGTVISNDFGAAFRRIKAKAITADTGGFRLDDALHGTGRDCGIKRIAVRAQNIDGRERCQWVRSRRDAFAGMYRRAAGEFEISHETKPAIRELSRLE